MFGKKKHDGEALSPNPELQQLLGEEDELQAWPPRSYDTLRPLTRQDLVKALTTNDLVPQLNIPFAQKQNDARAMLDFIENTIADALVEGRVVQLGGFLKLDPVLKPARRGRNPQTGAAITIPARRVVKVKVLKHLADRVQAGA